VTAEEIDNDRRDRAGDERLLTAAIGAGDEVLRWGIEGLVRSVPEIGAVRACANPGEFAALFERQPPDVVLITCAEAAWLEPVQRTIVAVPVTVLVVVDGSSAHHLPTGVPATVNGFLWQADLTAGRLRDTLHRCRNGEIPIPAGLARALLARADEPARRPRGQINLTSREREALGLLVQGLSNKQIARALSISSHGAKRLVTSIMLKLDSPNRTLAAVTAVRSGLVADR
jgi:two-component system nitrate/nitrite response regulator NarL